MADQRRGGGDPEACLIKAGLGVAGCPYGKPF